MGKLVLALNWLGFLLEIFQKRVDTSLKRSLGRTVGAAAVPDVRAALEVNRGRSWNNNTRIKWFSFPEDQALHLQEIQTCF